MATLDQDFKDQIQEALDKNPDYKLFVEQHNYINEEAIQWVLFVMDHYVRYGGTATVDKIRYLFGMDEDKAKLTLETLKSMGIVTKN